MKRVCRSSFRPPAFEVRLAMALLRRSLASSLDIASKNWRKRGARPADLSCRSDDKLARIAIRPRGCGSESCVRGMEIRRAEFRSAERRSFFCRSQDRQPRAAKSPSGQEQSSPRPASASWPLGMLACSCPPSHRRRERRQPMAFAMRELAATDAPRSGRNKCAKAERRPFLRPPATREAPRPKFATARRALVWSRSAAGNAWPAWRQCGPAYVVSAHLVCASARSPPEGNVSNQLSADRCATSPVSRTSRNSRRQPGYPSSNFEFRISNLSKDDLEELNALPFSRNVWIKRRVFHPGAIFCRRSRIEHLEWISAADCLRNHSCYLGAL